MEKRTVTHQNIIYNLSSLANFELQEVENFVKFLLHKKKEVKLKEPETLSGIWRDIGFEKFNDLDKEINSLRAEIGTNLLNKTFD